MNISRNNYEEFFLMYVDHELSAAERKIVEAFVRENQDLQGELDLLEQTKLIADPTVVFEHKEFLMKEPEGDAVINFTNYEEYFLLYADNELTGDQQRAVQLFASQSERLQKEFDMIMQCRLEPEENIIFEGKEILYRSARDHRPLLIPLFRISAAAIILLIGAVLVFRNANKPSQNPSSNLQQAVAGMKKADSAKKLSPDVTRRDLQSLDDTKKGTQGLPLALQAKQKKSVPVKKNRQDKTEIRADESTTVALIPAKKEIVQQETAVLPERIQTTQLNARPDAAAALVMIPVKDPAHDQINQQVVYNYLPPDTEDGINILTTSSGKNKMRGLFRKVSRVFEKTTKMDGDGSDRAVLIGNVQIALK